MGFALCARGAKQPGVGTREPYEAGVPTHFLGPGPLLSPSGYFPPVLFPAASTMSVGCCHSEQGHSEAPVLLPVSSACVLEIPPGAALCALPAHHQSAWSHA